jgi:hypothetical protein
VGRINGRERRAGAWIQPPPRTPDRRSPVALETRGRPRRFQPSECPGRVAQIFRDPSADTPSPDPSQLRTTCRRPHRGWTCRLPPDVSRRNGAFRRWPALSYRSFVHQELVHTDVARTSGCRHWRRRSATPTRPSRHDRAKISQRTSLTSHNEPSCCSQDIFRSPQLTAGYPYTPVADALEAQEGVAHPTNTKVQ